MFLRCFDVPLLVILSGILANESLERTPSTKRIINTHYYVKRFKRLVLPTWIMLVLVFSYLAAGGTVYSAKYYLFSFCLTRNGIGYVWIILIYLYCALVSPFLKQSLRFPQFWFVATLIYCLYEMAYYFHLGTNSFILLNTVYFIVPYGLLTALGMSYKTMKKRTKVVVFIAGLFISVICAIHYHLTLGGIPFPSITKYPPRLYFLSYSTAISFFLLVLCEGRDYRLFRCPPIQYISSHSLWIYLWHIFYLTLDNRLFLFNNWILRYVLVVFMSIITVWLQNLLLDKLETVFNWSVPKYLRG